MLWRTTGPAERREGAPRSRTTATRELLCASYPLDGHRGIGQGLSDTAAVLLQSLRDHQPLHAAIEAQAAAIEAEPAELVASVLEFVRGGLVSGLLVVRDYASTFTPFQNAT